ncbi:hypothetical protein FNV43_RR14523 [Rhamnella rubrinervis]|uniref:Calmodulin-binding domain-containing protein n=1 Tax=Rhamnella rubrinervis TaxID=2594499 RepID=A0A8K0MGF5_9ROSA|nr:hypothetical protein FNV43_RR14523 [Rhamnella rubrinervis]
MAEESINLQQDEDNSRRNSTGKSIASKTSEKIVPHYLRASTGSCHDFCKYGRKHAFEEKARQPIWRKMATKSVDSLRHVDIVVPMVGEKASLVRLKHSPLKAHSPDRKLRSPNTFNISRQQMLTKSLDNQNSVGRNVRAEMKKTSLAKLKSSPPSKPRTYDPPKTIKQEVSSSTDKLEVSLKQGSSKAKEKNLSAKHSTSLKPKSVTKKPISSPELPGGLKGNSDMKISKRTGISLVVVKKELKSPTTSVSPVSPKPSVSRVASLNARKQWNLKKVVSPLKNQKKIKTPEPKERKNDVVQEKTLYVIKMETESKTVESDRNENCAVESPPPPSSLSPKSSSIPNSVSFSSCDEEEDQQESEYSISESEDNSFSEDNEMESTENAKNLDEDNKRMAKKSGMVCVADNDCKSSKLKFRRGKVVDMQADNNGPRRLKFRRGRVLGDNHNVKLNSRRRSFKRREAIDDNDAETNPEKVVLRHQDVQGKKDAQGLFNNVIEETASKLVETRKSKVKALVGAFETVISLQDSKPSANTVT